MFWAIQNFRFGLDTRRSELTSQPGTLVTLDNAHINEGGEIEKRKAFGVHGGLTGTFGLVAGVDQLFVFGSSAVPGTLPATLFNKTLTYVRCQHPDGVTPMVSVLSGTLFNGQPFIVAVFQDQNTYPFYAGVLITDFSSGLVTSTLNTNTKIGTNFAGLVNAVAPAYTATDHLDGSVDVFNTPNSSLSGYTTSVVVASTAGTLTSVFQNQGTPAVSANAAIGQFSLMAGTVNAGTNKISSVKVGAAGALVEILNVAVDWVTDAAHTAIAVAAQINSYTSTPDYVATANGNVVNIYTTSGTPGASNGFLVQTGCNGNVCVGDCIFSIVGTSGTVNDVNVNGVNVMTGTHTFATTLTALVAAVVADINANSGTSGYLAFASGNSMRLSAVTTTSNDPATSVTVLFAGGGTLQVVTGTSAPLLVSLSPTFLSATYTLSGGYYRATTIPASVLVQGGVPPFTYKWTITYTIPQTSTGNVVINSPTSSSTTFTARIIPVASIAVQYYCTVTDSAGSVGTTALGNLVFV